MAVRQIIINGFNDVFAVHLTKKEMTIADLKGIVFNNQKQSVEDTTDKFGKTADQYIIKITGTEDALDDTYVLKEDDNYTLFIEQTE